ncbi:MAG TPA: hypothetical protein ENI45_00270, partial [Thermoplasmatales archaeon]|nr:hypothetical protein [Thermoplasmatales archaeon]
MKNSILKIITVFAVSLIITPSTLPSDTLQISVGYSKPMPFPPAYIRGYVRDNASHSPLPGANVQAVGSPQSGGTNVVFTTTTNENGYYELLVHSGYYYTVTASYEGYNSQTQNTGYLMSGAQKWIYFYLDSSSPGYTLWNSPSYTVWFAPATTKIFNSTQPPVSTSSTIEIECARNENEPFQIVIQPAFLLTNVTVEIGDLINQETGE